MIKYDGKPFNGVTYNQGSFAGERGHLFINGVQQCKHQLNLVARNRIWNPIATITKVQTLITNGGICEQCAKTVTNKINAYQEGN